MKISEKDNNANAEFGIALEESASSLTKGLHGRVPEGWNQRTRW